MGKRADCVKDIAGSLLFMALGVVFLQQLADVPENAAKYPTVLIYLVFLLCLALIVRAGMGLRGKGGSGAVSGSPLPAGEEPPAGETLKFGLPTLAVLSLSFLYVLVLPYAGFTISSVALMVTLMLIMGVRNPWVLVLVPVCETAFLLYVFEKLLALFLPGADALRGWLGFG